MLRNKLSRSSEGQGSSKSGAADEDRVAAVVERPNRIAELLRGERRAGERGVQLQGGVRPVSALIYVNSCRRACTPQRCCHGWGASGTRTGASAASDARYCCWGQSRKWRSGRERASRNVGASLSQRGVLIILHFGAIERLLVLSGAMCTSYISIYSLRFRYPTTQKK